MVRFTLLTVGKLKDAHFSALCDEYARRLERYARLEVIELKDGRGNKPDAIKTAEATALLDRVDSGDVLVALTRRGRALSSTGLAKWLSQRATAGQSRFSFVIGGPYGLSSDVLDRAQLRLSLSALTFTHEMARLFLLEQLYRAMTIWRSEPYHKGG